MIFVNVSSVLADGLGEVRYCSSVTFNTQNIQDFQLRSGPM
jgi:hypothetical protein